MVSTPEEVYDRRCERFTHERGALSRRMDRVANLRLVVFLGAAICVGLAGWWRDVLFAVLGVGLLGGFVALVIHHARLHARWRRIDELWRINDEASKRLARAWAELPPPPGAAAPHDHPYADDLDVYGNASLFHLLWPGGTRVGEGVLAAWLGAPALPQTVRERQAAVAEFAPLLDLRQELALHGRLLGHPAPDAAPLLEWAEGEPWLTPRRWLVWLARLSTGLLWLLILGDLTGLVGPPIWMGLFFFNLALSSTAGRRVYEVAGQVGLREGALRSYAELFELLSRAGFQSPRLQRLQATLTGGEEPAHRRLLRLHRLSGLLVPQGSVFYVPAQGLALWDFHVLDILERWQRKSGRGARGWLEAMGEAEALAALAGLSHDNPEWAFPRLEPDAPMLRAAELGHPLIPGTARVHNDVEVGPEGTFLLVTGSNMSGKSTLLRAIGTNLVLAGAGGPVCASELHAPPVRLWTSMRVQDSLTEGTSYFMAELKRLKQVVDAARRQEGGRLFYLLDEILQGTNTHERQVAARRIIAYLVEKGALGAVSTHDLTLADAEPLRSMARCIHFTETVSTGTEGPRMSFDYKARPGIATSTNALRLMQIVGLELDEA